MVFFMIFLQIQATIGYKDLTGHLNNLHEMHIRDVPGPNSIHDPHHLLKKKNKHHEGLHGDHHGGHHHSRHIKHSAMHSNHQAPHSHGGKQGGVFGPTGSAKDNADRKLIKECAMIDAAEGDTKAAILANEIHKDDIKKALREAKKLGDTPVSPVDTMSPVTPLEEALDPMVRNAVAQQEVLAKIFNRPTSGNKNPAELLKDLSDLTDDEIQAMAEEIKIDALYGGATMEEAIALQEDTKNNLMKARQIQNELKYDAMEKAFAEESALNYQEDELREANKPVDPKPSKLDGVKDYVSKFKELLNSPEKLGVIETIPDDAKTVEIANGYMKMPLKIFSKEKPKTAEEVEAKRMQSERIEALRNKVTIDDVPSNLNNIKTGKGFYNIPESAKKLKIEEGTIFYPESVKEEMQREGKDVSNLEHHYNSGERKDMAIGEGYYSVDVSGKEMELPSPSSSSSSTILYGKDGVIEAKKALGMEIKKGHVEVTPWKEYSKNMRLGVNLPKDQLPISPKVKKAMEEAVEGIEKLAKSKTEVFTNPDGKKYIKITPPLGVSEQMDMESLVGSNKLLSTKPGSVGDARENFNEQGDQLITSLNVKSPERLRAGEISQSLASEFSSIDPKALEEHSNVMSASNSFSKSIIPMKENMLKTIDERRGSLEARGESLSPKALSQSFSESGGGFSENKTSQNLINSGSQGGYEHQNNNQYRKEFSHLSQESAGDSQNVMQQFSEVINQRSKEFSSRLGMSETEFKSSYEKIPERSKKILLMYKDNYNDPEYLKEYYKAFNELNLIYGTKSETMLKILSETVNITNTRINVATSSRQPIADPGTKRTIIIRRTANPNNLNYPPPKIRFFMMPTVNNPPFIIRNQMLA